MSEMPASAPLWLDLPEDHPMGEGDTSGEVGSIAGVGQATGLVDAQGQGLCWYLWEGLPGLPWVSRHKGPTDIA